MNVENQYLSLAPPPSPKVKFMYTILIFHLQLRIYEKHKTSDFKA